MNKSVFPIYVIKYGIKDFYPSYAVVSAIGEATARLLLEDILSEREKSLKLSVVDVKDTGFKCDKMGVLYPVRE